MGFNEDWGKTLDSYAVEKGLKELNPDMHFDLAAATGQLHPFINQRQGVFYKGTHICSMDRGTIPEFKVWTMKDADDRADWAEADKEDARVKYMTILKSDPAYADLYEEAKRGKNNDLQIMDNGKLVRRWVTAPRKVRDRVVMVGWRHTFERIIMANIPHLTREAIASKFNINMWMVPTGGPEETWAMLVEE